MKDLSPFVIGVQVARVSIWDSVGDRGQTVADVLDGTNTSPPEALIELLRVRVGECAV